MILQCIFILAVFGFALVLPETPRWLIAHGHKDEARDVYTKIYGNGKEAQEVFNQIIKVVTIEDQVQAKGIKKLLRKDDIGSRRRLLIACGIQFFQQLGGTNGIICEPGPLVVP